MSVFARRTAAAAAAILTIAMVAILALRLAGAPIALGPEPSATASPTAVAGSASPAASPGATPEPATDEALARIESQVQDLRSLPAPDIGPPDVITRAQLADEVATIVDESWTPEELERANLTLQAMGLLTADQDLAELTRQLLAGEVIGFYEYTEQRMVVVSDVGLDPVARVSYAHEYTHALQDAAFDAGSHLDGLGDDDAAGAYQALLEGDATLLMFQWAFAHLAPDEIAQIGTTPVPDTTGIPDWMIQQLQWPYLAGLNFLTAVSGMTFLPNSGNNWSAVDAVYDDPPVSTEQVIHPEKYLDREAPMEVEPIDVAAILGDGWENLEPNTVGEAMISIWLTELGAGPYAEFASEGWGGDRQVVAAGPDGAWALAWRMVFDTPEDQDQFEVALGHVREGFGSYRHPSDTELIVLTGSTTDIALQLGDAIGPPAS